MTQIQNAHKHLLLCNLLSLASYVVVDTHNSVVPAFWVPWSEVKADVAWPNARVWWTECDWVRLHQQAEAIRGIFVPQIMPQVSNTLKLDGWQDVSAKSWNPRSHAQSCWSQFLESGPCLTVAVRCHISINVTFIDTLTQNDAGSEQTLISHKGIFSVCFLFSFLTTCSHWNDC